MISLVVASFVLALVILRLGDSRVALWVLVLPLPGTPWAGPWIDLLSWAVPLLSEAVEPDNALVLPPLHAVAVVAAVFEAI